jgi:hypothetical protein
MNQHALIRHRETMAARGADLRAMEGVIRLATSGFRGHRPGVSNRLLESGNLLKEFNVICPVQSLLKKYSA